MCRNHHLVGDGIFCKPLPGIPDYPAQENTFTAVQYQHRTTGAIHWTNEPETDSKIEYAKKLFFEPHSTFEHKRSACETLSFVLVRYRKELSIIFQGDTETFFSIVNQFSIRHNNNKTKFIEHEEQLEWIIHGLLNTIYTYVKMKKKLA